MSQKIHIPIGEYAFIEEEYIGYNEENKEITPFKTAEQLVARAKEITDAYRGREGLSDKEFDEFIQRQLLGEPNHMEDYNRMSAEQQKFVQCNKRALKRIEYSKEDLSEQN